MKEYFTSEENQEEEVHLRDILEKYLVYWKWFVSGVFLCFVLAFLYLRYTTPQYEASTTILVKDEKKGGMLTELSAFADMGLGSGMKSNVDNEVEVLKSRSLVESTVKKLQLNVSIVEKGRVNTKEMYKNAPFEVHFINNKPSLYTDSVKWELIKLSPNTFGLINTAEELSPIVLTNKKEFRFGEVIPTRFGDLIVTKSFSSEPSIGKEDKLIYIVVNSFDKIVASYKSRLLVEPISKTSSVVTVSMTDAIAKRSEDFLNTLIQNYNSDAAADKNFISENTSKFIANRLLLITQELDGVEQDVEQFKQSNGLTDIESEAKLFIESSSDYNKMSIEKDIQLNVIISMLEFMKKSGNFELLPTNLISGDANSATLITSYNKLILDRNRILKSATADNPMVVKLEEQIASLKLNVTESLERLQANLTIQKRNLKSKENLLDSKIGKIPVQERQFRVIARQQKVKEELYLYLLQKREETAISLAATAPNARVIDEAKASLFPVSPKKNFIYLVALLFGLTIPFGILYAKDIFDTKVKNRFDITERFTIPFLGDVPRAELPNTIIDNTSRTSTAEALRIVRANMDYMLTQVPDGKAKSIFVTSTIPGEGKTFMSVNLASIFAHSGKKVLLIGMDIRKPKLNLYFGAKDPKGLTDYLSAKKVSISDYITSVDGYDAFDLLLGGIIPPNPTEMLMSAKVDDLFTELKSKYDYIIVDTAPVSLVSDTLIVAKHADTFMYVVRANYLDKRMLNIPAILHKENKLPNMAFILNDIDATKSYGYGGYGYGTYGYGHIHVEVPWYKRFLKNK